ncbi:MAG TPA: SET domain-containing protein-lysine N-methyltransferase [Burkholderiales bacterium]|nr:SET domain-containing protein-lysine N-methyltransferase [Burkholderiales bacterium]
MTKNFVSSVFQHFTLLRRIKPTTERRPHRVFSPAVYIANVSTSKGRGVFAARQFSAGDVVERCPILVIDEPRCELPEQLKRVVYDWNDQGEINSAIALGFGSLYSHHASPNMCYDVDAEQALLVFKTIRPVQKGEALTVNYSAIDDGPFWDSGDWLTIRNNSPPIKQADVYLKDTGAAKGMGAFASRNFSAGELIEECPVILFKVPFSPPGELRRRVFSWLALVKNGGPYATAVALGFGSMYNHDDSANMRYEADAENATLKFTATRDIKADEELMINYNASTGEGSNEGADWFKRMNVQRIDSDR